MFRLRNELDEVPSVIIIALKDIKYSSFIKPEFFKTRTQELYRWLNTTLVKTDSFDFREMVDIIVEAMEKDFIFLFPKKNIRRR
jgi:hypothetical protein